MSMHLSQVIALTKDSPCHCTIYQTCDACAQLTLMEKHNIEISKHIKCACGFLGSTADEIDSHFINGQCGLVGMEDVPLDDEQPDWLDAQWGEFVEYAGVR